MRKMATIAAACGLAALACVGEGHIRWENTPIGSGEGVFKFEIKDVPVDAPPPNTKKVGDGVEVKTSRGFDILDANENGIPDEDDLLRDQKTGRCYLIRALKKVGGTQSWEARYEVVIDDRSKVSVPFEWGPGRAEDFLRGHGFDSVRPGSQATLNSVRSVWVGPWAGADTMAVVAVAYSSRFRTPDLRRMPALGSEMHSLRADTGELFMVNVLQGRLGDIVAFLAEMGLRVFTLRVAENAYLRGIRDPEELKRDVRVFFGRADRWTHLFTLGF